MLELEKRGGQLPLDLVGHGRHHQGRLGRGRRFRVTLSSIRWLRLASDGRAGLVTDGRMGLHVVGRLGLHRIRRCSRGRLATRSVVRGGHGVLCRGFVWVIMARVRWRLWRASQYRGDPRV